MGKIVSKCINPPCECFGRDVVSRHEIIVLPDQTLVQYPDTNVPRFHEVKVAVPEIIRVSTTEIYTPMKYYIKSTEIYRGRIL
jgi:hypothetical protein